MVASCVSMEGAAGVQRRIGIMTSNLSNDPAELIVPGQIRDARMGINCTQQLFDFLQELA
jgi:hypothetical protein